jgi:cytochrome c-type biogenesis protein CcsB
LPPNVHLAHVSDVLFAWTVGAYALAMLLYAAEFAFGRRGRGGRFGRVAVAATVAGWGLHVGSVATRGFAAHRVPWGDMYEFSSMASLVAVTVFLVMLSRERVRLLGAFVLAPVVLYLGLAGTVLYAPAGPLQPVLNSYWIKIHVVAAIVASGAFMFATVVTLLYLCKERYERRFPSLGPGAAAVIEVGAPVTEAVSTPNGGLLRRLPSAATLDRLAYRTIAFGFPVWTFAVIAGAIWAEKAWSAYWTWDPKETWSFITWLGYAAYLHARATAGWRGRRAAVVSLVAFGCLLVDYYLVNTVITGLHSYAGLQ